MTPETPPVDLVAHAAFVRRLAWRLLGNDAEADDAAQETLTRAMERPPRAGPGVGAWLAAVLRNVVRRGKRSEGRRVRRERASARSEAAQSADTAAARGELLRRVTDAVNGLDRAHREVVLLRHYEDLPPRAVAVRLGVPVETVKGRLKRAHAALRASLDESAGGNVEGWRGALCALAGLPLRGETLAATTVAGGIAMTTTGKIAVTAAAAALISVAAWKVLPAGDAPLADEPGTAAPELARLAPGELGDARLAARPAPAERPGAPTTNPAPATGPAAVGAAPAGADAEVSFKLVADVNRSVTEKDVVEGVILGASSLDGVSILLEPFGGPNAAALLAEGTWPRQAASAIDGTFRFTDVPSGSFALRVVGPGATRRPWMMNVPQQAAGNHRQPVVFGTCALFGRVFDREGLPIREVDVTVRPGDWHTLGAPTIAFATTDAEGGYRIEALRSGTYSVYVSIGKSGSLDFRVDGVVLAPGESRNLDLGERRGESVWSGTIRNASGLPLSPPTLVILEEKTRGQPVLQIPVDGQGRFSQRVPRGVYRGGVWYRSRSGAEPPGARLSFELTVGDGDVARDLAAPGVRLSGVVRDGATGAPFAAGTAPAGIFVRFSPADAPDPGATATQVAMDPEHGTFAVDGIPAGRWRIAVTPPAGFRTTTTDLVTDVPADRDVGGLVLEIRRE